MVAILAYLYNITVETKLPLQYILFTLVSTLQVIVLCRHAVVATYVCMYVFMYVYTLCMYVCTVRTVCMYLFKYVCMYVRVCTYIHIRTYVLT